MNRPITVLHAGALQLIDGGVVLVGWSIDTGGRGEVQACIGEVMLAVRDHVNKCMDDMLLTLPASAFDAERGASAKAVADKLLGGGL